jgi:hypothetical protein
MRRQILARIAALATAAAALGMFLVPARAEAADHQPDGCGDRDSDVGSDTVASATTPGVGSILDGWANRDLDIDTFGSAMTPGSARFWTAGATGTWTSAPSRRT